MNAKDDEPTDSPEPPDGRGGRPTDPNELAQWLVDQTTADTDRSHTSIPRVNDEK